MLSENDCYTSPCKRDALPTELSAPVGNLAANKGFSGGVNSAFAEQCGNEGNRTDPLSPNYSRTDDLRLEKATNGLVWVIYPNGYRYAEYFPEAYAMYLQCEDIKPGNGLDKSEWPVAEKPEGYTYFARATETGRIKIGRSRRPNERMNDISYIECERIELLVAIPDGYLEWYYLGAYADHRIKGEWFAPHPDILAEISYLQNHPTQTLALAIMGKTA